MRKLKSRFKWLLVVLAVLMIAGAVEGLAAEQDETVSIGVTTPKLGPAQAQPSTPVGPSRSPVSPEFIDWQKKVETFGLEMYDEEGHALGHIPSPFDWSHMRSQSAMASEGAVLPPASYDLRSYGHVTSVKDQANCGACWTFGTYGSLESWLLKNPAENWDFSENHMKNYHGFDWLPCAGGNADISTAYLVRWSGPVSESDDPYNDWDDRPSPGGPCQKYLKSAFWFYSDTEMKNELMASGAMYVSFYWDGLYYNSSEYTYYYSGGASANHAVTLIGWDDNKVVTGAPGNGAWLIKNSWGIGWGNSGYFWLSYYDSHAETYAVSYRDAVPTSSYLTNYQYDPLGRIGGYGYSTTTAWGANVFTATASEDLVAVGFYAAAYNTSYEIYVYDNFDGTSFSGLLGSVSGTVSEFGYHTITLPSPISLTNGNNFSIVIKFTTPGYNFPVPAEWVIVGYSSGATAGAGESYISSTGGSGTWSDLGAVFQANICIKGLTSKEEEEEEVVKWEQPPCLDDPNCMDVDATDDDWWTYAPQALADDFLCTTTGRITDIHIWGSWLGDELPLGDPNHVWFTLCLYSNDPCGANGWSEPNELLWTKEFHEGEFDAEIFAEGPEAFYIPCEPFYFPDSDWTCWLYSFYIDPCEAFVQEGDPCNPVVYWLALQAHIYDPLELGRFGWKNSSEQWNDDAVWSVGELPDGLLGGWNELLHPQTLESVDLAFKITTIEEEEPKPLKWSQPPVLYQEPDVYIGWDEEAHDWLPRMVCDDFLCDSNDPITAIRWWGSFLNWFENVPPDQTELPYAFLLTIWDNVPAGVDVPYSHPNEVIWGTMCDVYDVNFYGWEYDPRSGTVDYAKFEFYQELDPEDYWYQPNDANVYWLGIMAIYGDRPQDPCYPWGWETRPHFFEDDAVRFFGFPNLHEIYPGDDFEPIEWDANSWDVCFELITDPKPVPKPPVPHLKWSQPPIEMDPTADTPTYWGWDELSFYNQHNLWFACWDWTYQCRGDADNAVQGNPIVGFWHVGTNDLNILMLALGSRYGQALYNPCTDFDHDLDVDADDQLILQTWYQIKDPPKGPGIPDCNDQPTSLWLMVADDFRCLGSMPINSIHWWGSHSGWEDPCEMPPASELPAAWQIGFWSNVPADVVVPYSYPEQLLWQIEVDANRVAIDQVGTDEFCTVYPNDVAYQYTLYLKPEEVFWQEKFEPNTVDNIFWLSIVAIYPDPCDPCEPLDYPWGWKTRPWSWMDDAVRFNTTDPCAVLDPFSVEPIEDPVYGESYDVAFELDTDPNYIKWEQPFTGIRDWPHYEDELSMATPYVTVKKWEQPPDPCWSGLHCHDSNIGGDYSWITLADDWLCDGGLVTDLHWWGSYENRGSGIDHFHLSIHEPNMLDPCLPGQEVWGVNVPFASLTEVDTGLLAQGGPTIYLYEYDLNDPFPQIQGESYWFDITAYSIDSSNPAVWYWQEAGRNPIPILCPAVSGGGPGVDWYPIDWGYGYSDMAFAVTSEEQLPEPNIVRLVADDWRCDGNTPVNALVWWGSYIGYAYNVGHIEEIPPPMPLPVKPDYFRLNIWTDVPKDPNVPASFSHPNDIIWEYDAYDYDEVLVGYDKHPLGEPNEPVFRYSVRLPEEEWFLQDDVNNNVYWLSVMAVYDQNVPNYDWGWTNHKHMFNDDAVEGYFDPPAGWFWYELYDQTGTSEDMSFILFTDPYCFPQWHLDFSQWVAVGKPECWCYPRQCHGDADGLKAGNPFMGYWYVGQSDLNIMSLGWLVKNPPKGPGILGLSVGGVPVACADFKHDRAGNPFMGYWRIGQSDLDEMSLYWLVKEPPKGPGTPPDCQPGNRTP